MRLIDADALMAECQLAQKQAERHGREYANAFYSASQDISTEWWCVEDMIENAPTVEERTGEWIHDGSDWTNRWICAKCGYKWFFDKSNYCPNCGADMRGKQNG